MKASPAEALAGFIEVKATRLGGPSWRVRVQCVRRPLAPLLLEGRAATPALARRLALVFSLCPAAQACAWESAAELALTGVLSEKRRKARAAALQLEALGEHLRRLAIDWPAAFGLASAAEGRALQALSTLRARALAAGGMTGSGLEALLSEALATARSILPIGKKACLALTEALSLEEVMERLGSLPAPLDAVMQRLQRLPGRLGRSRAPWLDIGSKAARLELARAMKAPGFSAAPRLLGRPAQTSALARRHQAPVLADAARRTSGCFTHSLAQLLELELWSRGLEPPQRLLCGFSPEPGTGVSFAATARGTLAFRTRIERGLVREAACVSPTDWNFQPGGAAEEALGAIEAPDQEAWLAQARLVLLQLDPCLPCRILKEARHA